MFIRRKRFSLLMLAIVASLCLYLNPSALADDHGKKETKSDTHSAKTERPAAKKKTKDKLEEVEPERAIGSDSKSSKKEFDAELEQGGKVDAVLLLDSSRSMQRTDPQRLRDQAAKLFIRFLTPGDRVAIIQFDREAKMMLPFTEANEKNIAGIDQAIAAIENEGGFTDLQAPIEAAGKLLGEQGRKDAVPTVMLLSDGKMDPFPSRGTAQQLIDQVRNTDLANYRSKGLKLYTLSFSDETDKLLLESFAKEANGLNWFAPDATTIHKKFSELFLTLKRPQVVPLEGEGFEVDPGVKEATFYVSRKTPEQEIMLVNPQSVEISSTNLPPGIKWFRGDLFDVITVPNPLPGRWGIRGLEKAEGFATLLSDIKLQVRWPQSNFKIGDSVAYQVRLTNNGDEISSPGFDDITFYTFKIVNTENGEIFYSGALNDKGESGDEKADDNIYSGTTKLDKEGDFQALFAVTSPTFTRQQRISFVVSEGLVQLKVVPGDEFAGIAETIQVEVAKQASELKNLKIQLVAKKAGEKKPVGITLAASEEAANVFPVPLEKLEAGEYELYAKLAGVDAKKKTTEAASETLHYVIAPHEGEVGELEEVAEEEGEDEAPQSSYWLTGIISVILAGAWIAGLGYFGLGRVTPGKSGQSSVAPREPYTVPESLSKQIETIREKCSKERRAANSRDAAIFQLVQESLGTIIQASDDSPAVELPVETAPAAPAAEAEVATDESDSAEAGPEESEGQS